MVVVPQRCQRLIDIAVGLVVGAESGQHVGILLIVKVADLEEIAWEAVAFRRRVPIVKVSSYRRDSEAAVLGHRWKRIVVPHQDGRAVVIDVGGAGARRVSPIVECPDCLERQIRRLFDAYRVLPHFIEGGTLNESIEHLVVTGS